MSAIFPGRADGGPKVMSEARERQAGEGWTALEMSAIAPPH